MIQVLVSTEVGYRCPCGWSFLLDSDYGVVPVAMYAIGLHHQDCMSSTPTGSWRERTGGYITYVLSADTM